MTLVQKHKEVLVVLSTGLTKKGRIPFFVKNRLDHAYKIYHLGHAKKIIVSGKKSLYVTDEQPLTDAEKMSQYLQSLGVLKKDILKEEDSQDLLSSIYYIKTRILIPKDITHIRIIASDFEDERILFAFKKILGTSCTTNFDFVHSQIKPEFLWNFFSYEREALVNTKAFLRKMKQGDHEFLSKKFFTATIYKDRKIGFIRMRVHEGNIGRRRMAKAHYSMSKVFQTRKNVFLKHRIDLLSQRTLTAGWWSGRFLNFLGVDENKAKYSLKFPLYLKDRPNMIREVKMIEKLHKLPDPFVPQVMSKNISESPYWYLYKVIPGTMSGNFGQSFSFNANFYTSKTAETLVSYLATIRNTWISGVERPAWKSHKYKHRIQDVISKYHTAKLLQNIHIQKGISIFKKNVYRFDRVRLVPSHNDLHPANILIGSDKKLYIIDFGLTGMNNIAFDFGLIYLFAWKNPTFRAKFLTLFVNSLNEKDRREFTSIFPYIQIYFHVWLLEYTTRFSSIIEKSTTEEAQTHLIQELEELISQVS